MGHEMIKWHVLNSRGVGSVSWYFPPTNAMEEESVSFSLLIEAGLWLLQLYACVKLVSSIIFKRWIFWILKKAFELSNSNNGNEKTETLLKWSEKRSEKFINCFFCLESFFIFHFHASNFLVPKFAFLVFMKTISSPILNQLTRFLWNMIVTLSSTFPSEKFVCLPTYLGSYCKKTWIQRMT